MIGWFRRWKAARVKAKNLETCRREGHLLLKSGEATPGKMVGGAAIPTGPAEFWFYSCKCGYGELNDPGPASYRRSVEEAERLKKKYGEEPMQQIIRKKKRGNR